MTDHDPELPATGGLIGSGDDIDAFLFRPLDAPPESEPDPGVDGEPERDAAAGSGATEAADGDAAPAAVAASDGTASGDASQRTIVARAWDRTAAFLVGRPIESWVAFVVVAACVVFTYVQVAHPFSNVPNLGWSGLGTVFDDNTPAGGDMGAHVWGPAYLRDHLLPSFRLTGWTPDWYAGMPAYQFYMVVPSLAIALLSYVLPYGVAFKLVAISGVVSLPIAVYAFGKLADLPFPAPPLMAVGATVFLFDRSFSIYGGNIPSTLAGEFAFSISLTFAVLYLGVLLRGLRTGRHRGWAALLLALTALCHLIPFIFVLVGTVLALALHIGVDRKRFVRIGLPLLGIAAVGAAVSWNVSLDQSVPDAPILSTVRWSLERPWGLAVAALAMAGYLAVIPGWRRHLYWIPVLAVGGMLSAFWSVPFYLQHKYMNDMGWEKREDPYNMLFDRATMDGTQMVNHPKLWWVLAFAAAGLLLSIIWGHRGGLFWGLVAVTMGVAFVLVPEGRLWNARLLPFYYLSLYLLAAIGIAEIGRLLSVLFARDVARPIRTIPIVTASGGLLFGLILLALPLRVLPGGSVGTDNVFRWGPLSTSDSSYIPSWADWNFVGYENKPAYPEYHDVVQTMAPRRRAGVRSGHVGARTATRPVRHADGVDAAAVLDRQLHRLDGGSVLRVVVVDAVPLHQPGRAVHPALERPARPALRRRPEHRGRLRPRHRAPADVRCPVLHGHLRSHQGVRPRAPGPRAGGVVGSVGDLRDHRRQRARRRVGLRAGRRHGPQRGRARARHRRQAEDRLALAARDHALVRRRGGVGRAPRRVGPRCVAAGVGRWFAGAARHRWRRGVEHLDRARLDELRRRPDRGARARAHLVLPELAGLGGGRSVARVAEPHGRRPDRRARRAHLRPDRHRLPRHAADGLRDRRAGRAVPPAADRLSRPGPAACARPGTCSGRRRGRGLHGVRPGRRAVRCTATRGTAASRRSAASRRTSPADDDLSLG
ncbi:MAG: hypothetical protein R2699_05095 [Acidimicrobiales bacterium]